MRKIIILLVMISVPFNLLAREDVQVKIKLTEDKGSSTGFYIPTNLEDSFVELKKALGKDFLETFKLTKEEELVKYHFSLGIALRNNWGLWAGSRLAKYFNQIGIYHPDDMSNTIIVSFWRTLNGKPIDLEEQVKYYQDYWKKVKAETKS